MKTQNDIRKTAARLGLYVETWSPGDGKTRYRFFHEQPSSYFGPSSCFTCLGEREADMFLTGYAHGLDGKGLPILVD